MKKAGETLQFFLKTKKPSTILRGRLAFSLLFFLAQSLKTFLCECFKSLVIRRNERES